MAGKTIPKETIKTIIFVVVGFLIIMMGIQIAFGTSNPFYVVASGSMIPVLQVYDVLVVQGHDPIESVEVGDIIVFDRPSDHDRVIVHRVVSIIEDDPRALRTKGDANSGSIPGTDYPITAEEYIGKVEYVIPQIGYATQVIKPPVNYIIIAVVIGIMILKWQIKKKRNENKIMDYSESYSSETTEELSDIDKIQPEPAYTDNQEIPERIEEEEEVEEIYEEYDDSVEEEVEEIYEEYDDSVEEDTDDSVSDGTTKEEKPKNDDG